MEEDKELKTIEDGQITDLDLDTKPDLKTENYEFELIGLKDPNDQRRFSRNFIKIDNFLKKIFGLSLKAGTGLKTEGDPYGIGQTFSIKTATKNEMGGIKIGENLTYNPTTGAVDGNPTYTHPTTEGNKHIPVGGAAGQFLKWLSGGVAQWAAIVWNDITEKPDTFPPAEHTHDYEPSFEKNTAFNKNFGTASGTVLEGAELAKLLGIPYGGILNNSNSKTVGTAYHDSTTKKTYKCTVTNSLNYADSNYYEAISNNDLLAKLQNLAISSGSNGNGKYIKLAGGFIIQSGKTGGGNRSFPIPFTECFVVVTAGSNPNLTWTNTTFNFGDMNFGSSSKPSSIPWIAIGY